MLSRRTVEWYKESRVCFKALRRGPCHLPKTETAGADWRACSAEREACDRFFFRPVHAPSLRFDPRQRLPRLEGIPPPRTCRATWFGLAIVRGPARHVPGLAGDIRFRRRHHPVRPRRPGNESRRRGSNQPSKGKPEACPCVGMSDEVFSNGRLFGLAFVRWDVGCLEPAGPGHAPKPACYTTNSRNASGMTNLSAGALHTDGESKPCLPNRAGRCSEQTARPA